MGKNLKELYKKSDITLQELQGKRIAINANNVLNHYLKSLPPLYNSKQDITSHYQGILRFITNLYVENINPQFVFDGVVNQPYPSQRQGSELTEDMAKNTKRLLSYLGVPTIDAPGEAAAQVAFMVCNNYADLAMAFSYDALLYGVPQLLRETITQDKRRRNQCFELISMADTLEHLGISYHQLVQIAILHGTKYNKGIWGIGAITGCKLIKQHKNIKSVLTASGNHIENLDKLIGTFTNPVIADEFTITHGIYNEGKIIDFLCDENDFSKQNVKQIMKDMTRAINADQQTLFDFSNT